MLSKLAKEVELGFWDELVFQGKTKHSPSIL